MLTTRGIGEYGANFNTEDNANLYAQRLYGQDLPKKYSFYIVLLLACPRNGINIGVVKFQGVVWPGGGPFWSVWFGLHRVLVNYLFFFKKFRQT